MNIENPTLQRIPDSAGSPFGLPVYETDPSGKTGSKFPRLPFGKLPGIIDSVTYVDTVDDLTNLQLTEVEDNGAYQTLGRRSVGDGGANMYYYDAGSSATCDGGLVLDGIGGDNSPGDAAREYAGTGTGRFFATNSERATTKQFGAVADGVADDSYRINAALFYAKQVYSDAGNYLLNDRARLLKDNTLLEFAPGSEWRSGLGITGPPDAGLLQITGSGSTVRNPQIDVLDKIHSGITIKESNIVISGGYVNNAGYNAVNIGESGVVHGNITIEDFRSDKSNTAGDVSGVFFATGAIWCGEDTGKVRISRCHLKDGIRGVNAHQNVTVTGCLIEDMTDGIGLYANHDNNSVSFVGNAIRTCRLGIKVSRNGKEANVSHNYINAPTTHASLTTACITAQGQSQSVISNNILIGGEYGVWIRDHGDSPGPVPTSRLVVNGNHIDGYATAGIELGGTGEDNVVSDNIITGTLGAGKGISLINTPSKGVISGNIVQGADEGINIAAGERFTLSGNRVTNATTAYVYGGTNNLVAGNTDTEDSGDSRAAFHILGQTQQLLLGYDLANYWSDTVAINGNRTIAGAGSLGNYNIVPPSTRNIILSLSGGGRLILTGNINRRTSTAADPTTTEYPTSGDFGVHRNTSSGDLFFAANDGGTIKKVALT